MPLTPTTPAPSSGVPVYFAPNVGTTDGGPGVFAADFPGSITSLTANDNVRRIYVSTNTSIYQIENPNLDPATAFYNGVSFTLSGVPVIRDFSFNQDGTQIIVSDVNEENIRQLTLSVPYDIGTASQTSQISISIDTDMGGVSYGNPNPAGIFQSFYIFHDAPPFGDFSLYRYDMSDPSNVSTGVEVDSDGTSVVRPYVLNFDSRGYRYFVSNGTFTNNLTEVQLSEAWVVGGELTVNLFPLPFSTVASFGISGLRQYNAVVQAGAKRISAFSSSFLMPTG